MENFFKKKSPYTETENISRISPEREEKFIIKKRYFELQLEFLKEIEKRTGKSILSLAEQFTPDLRSSPYPYKGYKFIGYRKKITAENIVEESYKAYLETRDKKLLEYHPEGTTRFGCFYYDYNEDNKSIKLHFTNAESDQIGPLDKSKIDMRKKEMRDLLADIKSRHKGNLEITCVSWLLNLPAFRQMFPEKLISNMKVTTEDKHWKNGPTIWGQFIDSNSNVKEDLARELLIRVKLLPKDSPLSEIFTENSKLMPPLETKGDIKDFYEMYSIK